MTGLNRRFVDRVFTVDTRDFWRPASESPADQGFHWNRNAATYLDIGLGMGRAMTKLLDYDTWAARFSRNEPERD